MHLVMSFLASRDALCFINATPGNLFLLFVCFMVPEIQCNDNMVVFLFPLIKDSEGVPPSKKMKVEASQQNVEEI